MGHIRHKRSFGKIIHPFGKVNNKLLRVNPTVAAARAEPANTYITLYEYNEKGVSVTQSTNVPDCKINDSENKITWINIDGLKKSEIESIGREFYIHPLIVEDILSQGQRAKVDELGEVYFALLNMLYFNKQTMSVETEQVSIVLGRNYVLSFQEDAHRDLFDPIRDKLNVATSKIRTSGADYLFYALIDVIVDNYFIILEQLGGKIESLEEEIIENANTITLAKISLLRKEMILLKRNTSPVRELVGSILRSDSPLIEERTEKYFKDVYDHIIQANELSENYRDMMLNLHDLYLSEVNLRMNEVMKVMAIVTCLLAPATVIGGIFGMNFNRMPWLHNQYGFFIAVGAMLLIPIWMIWLFKKRGWF